MFTDDQILAAQNGGFHEHPDCVRIAVAWLEAQKRTKGKCRRLIEMKHRIESWGGRYVSRDDVEVAAKLIGLGGRYPYFTISGDFVFPSYKRLSGIGEAGRQPDYMLKLLEDLRWMESFRTAKVRKLESVYQSAEEGDLRESVLNHFKGVGFDRNRLAWGYLADHEADLLGLPHSERAKTPLKAQESPAIVLSDSEGGCCD